MTIQQFIEKAIEGGWKPYASHFFDLDDPTMTPPHPIGIRLDVEDEYECDYGRMFEIQFDDEWEEHSRLGFMLNSIWLDVEAWKAVGKVEGWDEPKKGERAGVSCIWGVKMRGMVEALIRGRSVEQYLETI